MTSPQAAAVREGLPRSFGRYTLFDHIGRGGMADIYLAVQKDALLERRVVLKEILPELSGDEGFSRMLVSEAKLAANLRHGNVVQVIDLGRVEDRLFIVMEYVEGFDLNQLLARLSRSRIPLPAEFAVFVVRETLAALDYAHRARDADGKELSVVHRDVSPANVLISFEGEVKLCDFGIARALTTSDGDDADRLAHRSLVGKAAYMSPEHANAEDLDARADVFSAGILLWELCAGRRLYKGTEDEMLALARAGDVPDLPERGLPDEDRLRAILRRALARDRNDRFESAARFLAALDGWSVDAGLVVSQLKLGAFLTEHFGDAVVAERRARERRASQPPPAPPADEEKEKPEQPGPVTADEDVSAEPEPAPKREAVASRAEETDPAVVHPEPSVAEVDTRRLPAQEAQRGSPLPWIAVAIVAAALAIAAALAL